MRLVFNEKTGKHELVDMTKDEANRISKILAADDKPIESLAEKHGRELAPARRTHFQHTFDASGNGN